MPYRSPGAEIDLVYELTWIASGEVSQLGDPDRFQAGDDSRSAEADREHIPAFAGRDWHQRANAASMLENSRSSE
jgi:hypothetical protein